MKVILLMCAAALACGCTPPQVRCDGRLRPINAPAATALGAPPAAMKPGAL